MIQRIQTIYFLLIAGLMLAMLFMPLGYLSGPESLVLKANGIYQETGSLLIPAWILYAVIISVALNALLSIFLYKKRPVQIRMAVVNILQMILVYGFAFFYVYPYLIGSYETCKILPAIAMAFPVVALILDFIAIGAIRKDEKLIKSLDRIR